jgi:hypothetical protein
VEIFFDTLILDFPTDYKDDINCTQTGISINKYNNIKITGNVIVFNYNNLPKNLNVLGIRLRDNINIHLDIKEFQGFPGALSLKGCDNSKIINCDFPEAEFENCQNLNFEDSTINGHYYKSRLPEKKSILGYKILGIGVLITCGILGYKYLRRN